MQPLLIKNVELKGNKVDVHCKDGLITRIHERIDVSSNDRVFDSHGGALLPSIRDNHLHLCSLAARRNSIVCGPPEITDEEQLIAALRAAPGNDWIRGVDYHESVAGDLNAAQIDGWVVDRPVRIQHRSGRLWYVNSVAAAALALPVTNGGQLYRQDEHVREALAPNESIEQDLAALSMELASFGVTHVTDATPSNSNASASMLKAQCNLQDVYVMGGDGLSNGHRKIILDDYRLPDFESFTATIKKAYRQGRPVAIHAVSKVEIVFALAALREFRETAKDRLEHGTQLTADLIPLIEDLDVEIVPNPNFIFERGDQYIRDHSPSELAAFYPIRTLLERGMRCSFGTDAPFGAPDPWLAMRAAVTRQTRHGEYVAHAEQISPEEALSGFLPAHRRMHASGCILQVGDEASLVVLNHPWSKARSRLLCEDVVLTVRQGEVTYARGVSSAANDKRLA